jgi:hypothetical protein
MGRSFARGHLRRLERRSKGHIASFKLRDGSRFYYDPVEAYADFILFDYLLVRGEDPDLPAVYRALTEAADIRAALEQLRPERPDLAPTTVEGTFDMDALLDRRELVVRPEALEPGLDLSEP